MDAQLKFDKIGYWSELKLEILEQYAKRYSTILSAQDKPHLHHVYIDAFSGAGRHRSKTTGEIVKGSPLKALNVTPPFKEYFFIDLDGNKLDVLRASVGDRGDVHLFNGDSNRILLTEVFPRVRFEDYRRGLCLLDPYGLHLNWEVIATAGRMGSIEIFLNVPILDINRNALWRDPAGRSPLHEKRMTAFWGDESWKTELYEPSSQATLFGPPETDKKGNQAVAAAFRKRLKEVAGFAEVPEPLPMRNMNRAIIYYLFFASHKSVALRIVTSIFDRYRNRMA